MQIDLARRAETSQKQERADELTSQPKRLRDTADERLAELVRLKVLRLDWFGFGIQLALKQAIFTSAFR